MAKILLVADDDLLCTAIKMSIEREFSDGVQVYILSSGEEAIAVLNNLKTNHFSMSIVDYDLTGRLSGTEVTRKIKNWESNFPVVIIGGFEMDDHKLAYSRADFLIKKPFNLQFLKGILEQALKI